MLAQTLLLFMAMADSNLGDRVADLARARFETAGFDRSGPAPGARYEAAPRSVTNWKSEAAGDLEPRPVAALAALVEAGRPFVTRCVRLNNYWCIKSARWNGEVGTDDEGHVGFASAEHGADAAATLLRRYYLEFGRRSALDIVRRWAPAECGAVGGAGLVGLAVRGIGSTLRARYLASRRGRGKVSFTARAPGGRVSAVIPRAGPAFRVPDIAAGLGERKPAALPRSAARAAPARPSRPIPKPKAVASADRPATTGSVSPPQPSSFACAPQDQRIRNYADRIVEGLGLGPSDDLALFEPDGTPRPNLARVMLAMSSVELGTLRASADLVSAAVKRAADRARSAADAVDR